MADDVTVDNGAGTDYTVDTTELSTGEHVQSVQLFTAVSAGSKTALAKAEDAAHASGDAGVMALAVRKDTAAALAGTDGDYTPLLTDSSGRLHIAPIPGGSEQIGSVEVTSVTPGTGNTDLGKAEDAAHGSGDTGVMMLAVRKDTAAALAGTDGDYHPLEVDENGLLYVAVGSLPAADRTTDNIGVAHQTDAIMNDTTALTPKFKSATVAASQTDSSLVAAVTSKKIRVLALAVQCGSTATDVTFESDEATDVRLHKVPAGANGGQILPFNPVGWFETASGSALIVTTGAGSSVEISGVYVEV